MMAYFLRGILYTIWCIVAHLMLTSHCKDLSFLTGIRFGEGAGGGGAYRSLLYLKCTSKIFKILKTLYIFILSSSLWMIFIKVSQMSFKISGMLHPHCPLFVLFRDTVLPCAVGESGHKTNWWRTGCSGRKILSETWWTLKLQTILWQHKSTIWS